MATDIPGDGVATAHGALDVAPDRSAPRGDVPLTGRGETRGRRGDVRSTGVKDGSIHASCVGNPCRGEHDSRKPAEIPVW
jgi:hypothetical protein